MTVTRAGQPQLEAARLLLERMGVTPEQLLQVVTPRPPAPTFAKYLPVVGLRSVPAPGGSAWRNTRPATPAGAVTPGGAFAYDPAKATGEHGLGRPGTARQ